jgi:CRISPR/Cas system CSM-associated protein Csm2 small subunit
MKEADMGLLYKAYQHISYDALEIAREKGKEVVKQMQKEKQNKKYQEAREGIDYKALDKHWDDMLQECHDKFNGKIGNKSRTSLR